MIAPTGLQRDAPVRRGACERIGGAGNAIGLVRRIVLRRPGLHILHIIGIIGAGLADGVQLALRQIVIGRGFEIKHVVDEHIGARADAAAAETALDLRARRREGGRQGRGDIGEAPCRRGVPDVLDRGTIVDVEPIEHVDPADLRRIGVANIGVVEISVLRRLVVGSLHEGAEIAVDLAAIEQAHLLHDEIVVRMCAIG